jgi:hypothetical protein
MEYLRKEIQRFRKDATFAAEESSSMLRDNLFHKSVSV